MQIDVNMQINVRRLKRLTCTVIFLHLTRCGTLSDSILTPAKVVLRVVCTKYSDILKT